LHLNLLSLGGGALLCPLHQHCDIKDPCDHREAQQWGKDAQDDPLVAGQACLVWAAVSRLERQTAAAAAVVVVAGEREHMPGAFRENE